MHTPNPEEALETTHRFPVFCLATTFWRDKHRINFIRGQRSDQPTWVSEHNAFAVSVSTMA